MPADAALSWVTRLRGLVASLARKVRRPRERVRFVVYDVSPRKGLDGKPRRTVVARGIRRYRPDEDVHTGPHRNPQPEPSPRVATLKLTDCIGLEVALERIPALSGFAINVTRGSEDDDFSWNWFGREVFPEFRGAGLVRVETDDDGRTEQIVAVHFLTDATLAVRRMVSLKAGPDRELEVVIAAGSVLRLR